MAKPFTNCLIIICFIFSACGGGGGGGKNPPALSIPGNVILVDGAATGNDDGSSWANAYSDLQDALAVSVSGKEIWVAAGTYYTTDALDRTITFQLIDGVGIYGGFAGSELARADRDIGSNVSILSGDIGTLADNTDNTHHVVTGADNAILNGFTIRDGNTAGAIDTAGAGIYCKGSSPQIIACKITENEAATTYAGGVFCDSASPALINCVISNNRAAYGGGVYCTDFSSPSLTNCMVVNNVSANTGGGIRSWADSSPTLTNCTITGNDAAVGGGLNSNGSTPTLVNCIIWGNKINGAISDSLDDDYVLAGGSTDTVSYSLFISSYGASGIVGDPMFTDAAAGDYTLLDHSPVIDAGDNSVTETVDLAGNPRKVNGPDIYSEFTAVVDIGVFESQSPPAIAPNVILVDFAATGAGDGGTWSDAFNDLQDALATAADGNEIWVAAGTYYATDTADRSKTFQLIEGVEIYGGFDGSENERIKREITANVTALSGDTGILTDNTDNTYHVVTGADNAVLDGFTVSHGNATGAALEYGGGICCVSTSPTIANCVILNNTAPFAGGLYLYSCTASLNDCLIKDNYASTSGGGVLCYLSSLTVSACVIRDNEAAANGGGFYCSSAGATVLTNCLIEGNVSGGRGGGVECFNGAVPTLNNCTISGNDGATAGGFSCSDSSPTLKNCIVWGNKTGGVISNSLVDDYTLAGTSSPNVINSLFIEAVGVNPITVTAVTALFSDITAGDYTLLDHAPAIDAGDNSVAETVDLAGNTRKVNGPDIYSEFTAIVDIGAYESQSSPAIAPNVILVNQAATGANDGSNWVDAYNDLQNALSVAASGAEIWVAAGTYYPTSGADRTETFQLVDGVGVYGGFDGSENERIGRDVSGNVTTLSGDIGILEDNTDNTHHVLTAENNAILDGFTVSNGNSSGAVEDNGGGVYCGSSTSPTLNDCIISDNSAGGNGGGVYCAASSSPALTDCTITENTAAFGGGIYFYYSSPSQISCAITENTAGSGAGVYLYSSSPTLSDCSIAANESRFNGGGIYGNYTSAALENCTITDNTSDGGDGGGVYYDNSSAPTLSKCTISDNTADSDGGGISCRDSSPILSACLIINNVSGFDGGGVYGWDSSPILIACLIGGNEASNWGGGVYCYNSSTTLRNCTVSGNDAVSYGGLYLSAFTSSYFYKVRNCVVWGNLVGGVLSNSLDDDYRTSGGNITLNNSLFRSAVAGNTNGVVGDPLFADAANGDYTLLSNSPAIDMGENSVTETEDLAGNPRKVNGPDLNDNIFSAIVDLGAYENQMIGASTLLAPVSNN